MADKRSSDENQEVSPPKRTTRASAVGKPAQANLQRELSAALNTGRKLATKPAGHTAKNDGPLPSTGAVRKGTVTQQPIATNLTSTSQQPDVGRKMFIDASQHPLPDSDGSSNEPIQQMEDDRDVLIIDENETLEDIPKEPVPIPGQYAIPSTSVTQPIANRLASTIGSFPSTVSNHSMQSNASDIFSAASAAAVRSQAQGLFSTQQSNANDENLQPNVNLANLVGRNNRNAERSNVAERNSHSIASHRGDKSVRCDGCGRFRCCG